LSNLIRFQDCDVRLSENFTLKNLNLEIAAQQHWLLVGGNGSGKSAFAACLAGEGDCVAGERTLPQVHWVSFESQRALIDHERQQDDSDITDEVSIGTTVGELLADVDQSKAEPILKQLNFEDKWERGFRQLSTGETRKVLLTHAMCSDADVLVLDEPFEGLDASSCGALKSLLTAVSGQRTIVLVVNRLSEIPDWMTHVCILQDCEIGHAGPIDWTAVKQIMQLENSPDSVPRAEQADRVPLLAPGPLVRLKQARVAYGDEVIFSGLDWQVNVGEHWQVIGPNGSGKTCLLNLITGDHPQCYVNDVFVVGYQRGQGESIWDIKQHIGYVSSHLQLEYRVSINLLNVILSGFLDSIGLYEKPTDDQFAVAKDWLALFGMSDRADQPFNRCSYGEQKMLLIARAMVKHPQLLILDEPCLGLDEINRQLVLVLVEKICRSGETTVLYVNHHAEDKIPSITRTLNMSDYR
jgi:molybdate transport system ATP-binding protein